MKWDQQQIRANARVCAAWVRVRACYCCFSLSEILSFCIQHHYHRLRWWWSSSSSSSWCWLSCQKQNYAFWPTWQAAATAAAHESLTCVFFYQSGNLLLCLVESAFSLFVAMSDITKCQECLNCCSVNNKKNIFHQKRREENHTYSLNHIHTQEKQNLRRRKLNRAPSKWISW